MSVILGFILTMREELIEGVKLSSTLGGNDHGHLEFIISRGLRDNKNLTCILNFSRLHFQREGGKKQLFHCTLSGQTFFGKCFLFSVPLFKMNTEKLE